MMVSLNKRYAERTEVGPRQEAPPVSVPPKAATSPEPAPEVKPPPAIEEQSPVEKAEKDAIALQLRLREMENAERLSQQKAQQQQPPPPQEPQAQQQRPAMPAAVEQWVAEHPQYFNPNDVIAVMELDVATRKCARDGLTWNDDSFVPVLERHLGLRQQAQSNGNGQVESRTVAPAPRHEAPVRQQQRSAIPTSAPVHRDPPSMATGRPMGRTPPLTRDEIEIALASRSRDDMTDEEAVREYQANKARMLKLKAAGGIQDGR